MTKQAVLTFKKFIDRGDKKITLICFRDVRKYYDLPAEYLRQEKHFYRGNPQGNQLGTIFLVGFQSPHILTTEVEGLPVACISQGDTLDGEVLGPLVSYVRECGKDLGSILRRQEKANKGWAGDLEVGI